MAETKSERIEREYVIPLRSQVKFAPRYKRAKKAIRTIKEFLAQHMKIRDRDLDKIKLDKYLNEAVWARGIRHPPHKVKVKATREANKDIVRVELVDYPTNLKFKKIREEKINKQAKESVQKKKTLMEKAKESLKPSEKTEEEKAETKEKEKSSAQATQMLEKETAKQSKHETKMHPKEPKHQRRMALQK
jgi:large subunit ribosomal protein L31e